MCGIWLGLGRRSLSGWRGGWLGIDDVGKRGWGAGKGDGGDGWRLKREEP